MNPVRLEPAAPRSRVKYSTTEPLLCHVIPQSIRTMFSIMITVTLIQAAVTVVIRLAFWVTVCLVNDAVAFLSISSFSRSCKAAKVDTL